MLKQKLSLSLKCTLSKFSSSRENSVSLLMVLNNWFSWVIQSLFVKVRNFHLLRIRRRSSKRKTICPNFFKFPKKKRNKSCLEQYNLKVCKRKRNMNRKIRIVMKQKGCARFYKSLKFLLFQISKWDIINCSKFVCSKTGTSS